MENNPENNPEKLTGFFTHKQLAELYNVHPNTLTNWVKHIKGINKGPLKRSKLYSPAEISLIIKKLGTP
jgi:transposase-like protein